MFRLQKYDRARFAARFGKFRTVFVVGFSLLLASCLVTAFLFRAPAAVLSGSVSFWPLFRTLLTRNMLMFTLIFLLGVTVYAPVLQIVVLLLQGFFGGFTFSSLASALGSKGSVSAFFLYLLYFLLTAWLTLSYTSFCTLVSLRIYTDGIRWNLRAEEERVFGGTLFNSTLFCNTLNLRFLFSYSFFFFLCLAVDAAICSGYAWLLSVF